MRTPCPDADAVGAEPRDHGRSRGPRRDGAEDGAERNRPAVGRDGTARHMRVGRERHVAEPSERSCIDDGRRAMADDDEPVPSLLRPSPAHRPRRLGARGPAGRDVPTRYPTGAVRAVGSEGVPCGVGEATVARHDHGREAAHPCARKALRKARLHGIRRTSLRSKSRARPLPASPLPPVSTSSARRGCRPPGSRTRSWERRLCAAVCGVEDANRWWLSVTASERPSGLSINDCGRAPNGYSNVDTTRGCAAALRAASLPSPPCRRGVTACASEQHRQVDTRLRHRFGPELARERDRCLARCAPLHERDHPRRNGEQEEGRDADQRRQQPAISAPLERELTFVIDAG